MIKDTEIPEQKETSSWKVALTNLINILFFIINPNKWRLSLLEYLQADSVAEQNENLIDSGTIMTTSTRDFGVEIEFVHTYDNTNSIYDDLRRQFPNWAIKGDSSIRPSGTEINSPILSGAEGLAEVERMVDYLRGNKLIRVNSSCGLHVHVSVKDLQPHQVIAASYRYANAEQQFFDRIMDAKRNDDNRYCRSAKLNSVVDGFTKRLHDIDLNLKNFDHFRYNNHFDKYRKLNIHCYGHGTVEFRHHHATLNKHEILNWISFITSFIDSTKKNTENVTFDASHFEVEIPDTEIGKAYKAILDLRKFTQEYPDSGMFFSEIASLIIHDREIVHYDGDYNAMMANEANQKFLEKIATFGFTLHKERFRDNWNGYYYNRLRLKYNDIFVNEILNHESVCEEENARVVLSRVEKTIAEAVKKIDLFDGIPPQTLFYYSQLFDKKNKKIEKIKRAAINLLRERPEQIGYY